MMFINGARAGTIAANDRGLMYGDGVFRTLRLIDGRPHCWTRQYQKLLADCAALQIACPAEAFLRDDIAQLAAEQPNGVLKVIITRGAAARGYAVNPALPVTRIVSVSPLPQYPEVYYTEGVRVHRCALRLAEQPALAGIKHLNRLENVLARMEWQDPGIAEGLLLNERNEVIEGTMSNLFMRCGEHLYTPDLGRAGVAGVTRDRVLALAGELGLYAHIEVIGWERLLQADELLLTNSVIGAWPVRELAGHFWGPAVLAPKLKFLLEQHD